MNNKCVNCDKEWGEHSVTSDFCPNKDGKGWTTNTYKSGSEAERDALKEQLQKANKNLLEIIIEKADLTVHREKLNEQLRKAQEDKTEAVSIAVDRIRDVCNLCSVYGCNPELEYYDKNCPQLKNDIIRLESLTGRSWKELRG